MGPGLRGVWPVAAAGPGVVPALRGDGPMGRRTEKPRIVAYLDEDLRERVEAYAASQSLSMSTIALLALRAYLDEDAPESRKRRKS